MDPLVPNARIRGPRGGCSGCGRCPDLRPRHPYGQCRNAKAALAGGAAIGSTCDRVPPAQALALGLVAGLLSTAGYALVREKLQAPLRLVDSCGVPDLHGLPDLLGGLAALVGVADVAPGPQIGGIAIAITQAVASGLLVGTLIALTGQRSHPYQDAGEFLLP